ncbi:MAG TPA: hypothetical protein VL989_01830 [Candidatus Sulfotelmatobacter sp.]|nr:hypothetical protein [Candidatus Sulfotelmatobacter sp.]
MKKNDLPIIILVIAASAIVSFLVSKYIFASPKKEQQQVYVVQPIDSSFSQPSSQYFNSQSVDPAQQLLIGPSTNQNPFGNTSP